MQNVNTSSRQAEVVADASSALRQLGASLQVEAVSDRERGDLMHDGLATLRIDGRELTLPVQVKVGLRPSTVGLVTAHLDGGLLIGDHVSAAVGDLLRARGINYVDGAGNAHLRAPGILVDVRGRRPPERKTGAGRKASPLFTRAGLPVVLAVLARPHLLDVPLREVQAHTTVSLGSVQKVMAVLHDQGFRSSSSVDEGGWRRLYDGWVAAHLAGPRDDALIGRYSSDRRPRELAEVLQEADATSSGEWAAQLWGYDIAPVTFDLYAHESVGSILQGARLRPDPEGPVAIRRPSWTPRAERANESGLRCAPAPVVYADLLALHDPRADKVAEDWRANE